MIRVRRCFIGTCYETNLHAKHSSSDVYARNYIHTCIRAYVWVYALTWGLCSAHWYGTVFRFRARGGGGRIMRWLGVMTERGSPARIRGYGVIKRIAIRIISRWVRRTINIRGIESNETGYLLVSPFLDRIKLLNYARERDIVIGIRIYILYDRCRGVFSHDPQGYSKKDRTNAVGTMTFERDRLSATFD
jgi:hypothetical protein